jgi:hypothetical protein
MREARPGWPRRTGRRGALVAASSLVLSGALALATAGDAHAFERQHHVGVDLGVSLLNVADKSTLSVGPTFGAHYVYGLSDTWNLLVEGAYARVAKEELVLNDETPRTRPTSVWNGGVGIAYVLDVLRWVPYGGIIPSGYMLTGGTLEQPTYAFGGALALGLDYGVTRNLNVGIAFREHFMLTKASTYPTFTTFFARVEYVWGW